MTHSTTFVRALSMASLLSASVVMSLSCSSDGDADDGGALDRKVTWYQDVAPLVTGKCAGCHTSGGIAPFSVDTYEESKKWSGKMNRDIQNGSMPPWDATDTAECIHPAPFKDDLRLSPAEKELFQAWIDQGTPEGDPNSPAALPTPPALELPDPSVVLTIPTAVEVSGTSDGFTCFVLDPGNVEDVWLTGVQVTAGNPTIVHHVLVFDDPEDQGASLAGEDGTYECFGGPGVSNAKLLGAWAPGAVPAVPPAETGMPLRTGTKLVVQVHYHPTGNGVEIDDATQVSLRWTSTKPANLGALFLIGNFPAADMLIAGGIGFGLQPGEDDVNGAASFVIPAGKSGHVEEMRYRIAGDASTPLPLRLWAVGTHMHYVGTDMMIRSSGAVTGDQCLVRTPAWDFNWQRLYFFDKPMEQLPFVRPGDVLTLRCTYDNTLGNPFVRDALDAAGQDAPHDVLLGEETLDEMCLGVFGVAVPAQYGAALGLD